VVELTAGNSAAEAASFEDFYETLRNSKEILFR
jgi:hypothetical protein